MTQVSNQLTHSQKYPFVAFEHYMLADDRPTHSMTCHIRFWFKGLLDRSLFEKALQEVLTRHPAFQMIVQGSVLGKTRQLHWSHPGTFTRPFISWKEDTAPIEEPPTGFPLNLFKEIGLRFWIRENKQISGGRTILLVQFHHSVCDGMGLFQFMEDLLIAYGKLRGDIVPHLQPLSKDEYENRGRFGLSPTEWSQRRKTDLHRALQFFKSFATPLKSKDKKQDLDKIASLHASTRLVLDKDVLTQLREDARLAEGSVNDVMLAKLFKTLYHWNSACGKQNSNIRVAIATSLRGKYAPPTPATNIVSMVFLNRRERQIKGKDFLQDVIKETHLIKHHRLGMTLPRVLNNLGRFPFAIYQFLRLPICSATAVLTNLGIPFSNSPLMGEDGFLRVGSLTLESLETMPPVRPKTSASFSVNYYGKKLSVTLRYDSTVFSKESAQALLEIFTDELAHKNNLFTNAEAKSLDTILTSA